MKKLFAILGILGILSVIFLFAVALQIYTTTEPTQNTQQDTYNIEYDKPLTKLESEERESVQQFKRDVEARKKEVER